MGPQTINQIDLSKLKLGREYSHMRCHVQEFTYEDGEKLTFVMHDLKVHPFRMTSGMQMQDWRETGKRQLCLTVDAQAELLFLEQLESRVHEMVKSNPAMVRAFRERGSRIESKLIKMTRNDCPMLTVNLPVQRNPLREVQDQFKFTMRDGITGSIMESFKPSGENLVNADDRLSAVIQLDRAVAYPQGVSIQLTLYQGKLYPYHRLHELPVHHRLHGPEPGRFPIVDMLLD